MLIVPHSDMSLEERKKERNHVVSYREVRFIVRIYQHNTALTHVLSQSQLQMECHLKLV